MDPYSADLIARAMRDPIPKSVRGEGIRPTPVRPTDPQSAPVHGDSAVGRPAQKGDIADGDQVSR